METEKKSLNFYLEEIKKKERKFSCAAKMNNDDYIIGIVKN